MRLVESSMVLLGFNLFLTVKTLFDEHGSNYYVMNV